MILRLEVYLLRFYKYVVEHQQLHSDVARKFLYLSDYVQNFLGASGAREVHLLRLVESQLVLVAQIFVFRVLRADLVLLSAVEPQELDWKAGLPLLLAELKVFYLALQNFLDNLAHVDAPVRGHCVEAVRHGVDGLCQVVVHYSHQLVITSVVLELHVSVIVVVHRELLESVWIDGVLGHAELLSQLLRARSGYSLQLAVLLKERFIQRSVEAHEGTGGQRLLDHLRRHNRKAFRSALHVVRFKHGERGVLVRVQLVIVRDDPHQEAEYLRVVGVHLEWE